MKLPVSCKPLRLLGSALLLAGVSSVHADGPPVETSETSAMSDANAILQTQDTIIDAPRTPPALDLPDSGKAARVVSPLPANLPMTPTEAFVDPAITTAIKVSNRDVNRVHCAGSIEDVIWSNEKPMTVTPAKNGNVFVKFLVRRQGEHEVPATQPADLHIVCNGQVYTLILYPKASDSVTIHLGSSKAATLTEIVEEWSALPLEERVKKITLAMFREEIPSGFSRTPTRGARRDIQFYDRLSIQGVFEMRAPGLGLNATEYRVVSSSALTLDERDFLLPQFGNVVGITVDPVVLTPDQRAARLIVVERAASNGE